MPTSAIRINAVTGETEVVQIDATPEAAPTSVTPTQMRLALNRTGMRDAIEAYVATLSRDEQDRWDYGLTVERNNPVIEAGRQALNMSAQQVDDLFRLAASLA